MIFFLVSVLMLLSPFSHAGQPWILIEKKQDLELYSGPKSMSGVYSFKAKFVVRHSIEHVVMILKDTKRKTNWVPRMTKSMLLEQEQTNVRVEYGEARMPWPVANRDAIVRIKTSVSKNLNHVKLTLQSVMNSKIINKNNIRAKVFPSFIELNYNPKTKEIAIEAESFVDPGGKIPKWVVNFFQKIEIKNMAEAMKAQLDKNIYSKDELRRVRETLVKISRLSSKQI